MQKYLDRVYHPANLWEELNFNMWGEVDDRKDYLNKAIDFTGDHKLYGSYMMRVVNEWRFSCENALTDRFLNKKAWIGHAACALGLGCPEDIVRKAWGYLTDEQRLLANRQALTAIRCWEDDYKARNGIRDDVAQKMLFR